MVMYFHIEIEQLIQIERFRAGNRHAKRVANEIAYVMVFQELRMLGENSALGGLVHVSLEPHQSFFARLVEEFKHHLQGLDVSLLGEFRSPKDAYNAGY